MAKQSNWGWGILLALLALFGLKGTSGATPTPTPPPTTTPVPPPPASTEPQAPATPAPTPSTSGGVNMPVTGVTNPPALWVGWTLNNPHIALQELQASGSGLYQTAWIGNKGGLAIISAIDCYIYRIGTPRVAARKVKPVYLPQQLYTGQKVAQRFQSGPITEAGDYAAEIVVTTQSGRQSFSSMLHVYVWTAPPVTQEGSG